MQSPSKAPLVCLMSGAFPPPVNGLSLANAAMRDAVLAAGGSVETFPVAVEPRPGGLPLPLRKIGARIRAFARLAGRLATLRSRARLYLPVSGGLGQIGEIPPVLFARLCGAKIATHHHSFAYLDKPSRISSLLFAACGRKATHIVLCERMGRLLREGYPRSVETVVPLSNAAFHAVGDSAFSPREKLARIGYLSNITFDKGFDRFLDIVRELKVRKLPIDAVVAGPCEDEAVKAAVGAARDRGDITYIGPVYGEAKQRFLAETDLLVFPSRYANEAEPIVVIEAFSRGAPVISTRRGCIPGMVDESCGALLDPTAADIRPAVDRIEGWISDPASFRAASTGALARAAELARTGRAAREQAIHLLGGRAAASA